jgi:hypothetical protein
MTVSHPWQELQKAAGVEVTEINPLELGRPFIFTDAQRIALQPFFEAAGEGGAVLVVCTHSTMTNAMQARPVGLVARQRKTISAALTKFAKENK